MKLQRLDDPAIRGAMADDDIDIDCRKFQSESQSQCFSQRAVPMKILVLGLSRTGTNGMAYSVQLAIYR